MNHVFYAIFPSTDTAAAAIAEVKERGIAEENLSLILRREQVHEAEELELKETDGLVGAARGAVLGAIAGVITMAILVLPMGLIGFGPLAAAALGAGAGGGWGALASGLAGLGIADRGLDSLMDQLQGGRVLVTVTVTELSEEVAIEAIFQRHQAIEVRQQLV